MTPIVINLTTEEFRSLPLPGLAPWDGRRAKMTSFCVRARTLPADTDEWPELGLPAGPLPPRTAQILHFRPELFALAAEPVVLLADRVNFHKGKDGMGRVEILLTDRMRHGLASGATVLRELCRALARQGSQLRWDPYVRVQVVEGIDPDTIPVVVEAWRGLPPIGESPRDSENSPYTPLRTAMRGHPGADQIAYHPGDPGTLPVTDVLELLGMFDISRYRDRKGMQPNDLYGNPQRAVDRYLDCCHQGILQPGTPYGLLVPHAPELLRLADRARQLLAPQIAPGDVVAALFLEPGEKILGEVPLYEVFPVVSALRAVVSQEQWDRGIWGWSQNPFQVLEATIDELGDSLATALEERDRVPEAAGNSELLYRLCYSIVQFHLLSMG